MTVPITMTSIALTFNDIRYSERRTLHCPAGINDDTTVG